MTERDKQTMRDEMNAMRSRQQMNQQSHCRPATTVTLKDDEQRTLDHRQDLAAAWFDFVNADDRCPLNVRVDISLKQRRNNDSTISVLVRDPNAPAHVLQTVQRTTAFAPSLPSTVLYEANVLDPVYPHRVLRKVEMRRKCQPPISVRPKRSARSPRYCANHAAAYYLTEDETRRIATRVVNRLNKMSFGKAANRSSNPLRLTALVCQHDRGTRRHLHALFAVPCHISLEQFKQMLRKAIKTEPFIARKYNVEIIRDVAKSLNYNIRDDKTLTDNSILYVYPAQPEKHLTTKEEAHDPACIDRHRCLPPRAA